MLKSLRVTLTLPLAACVGLAHAADVPYPTKPIRFILGFPPGGASDAVARLLTAPVAQRLGQQLVIDNRPGAGGNIAGEIAARAAPDGHTWFLGNNGILATNQTLYQKMPFDSLRDFATVILLGTQPSVLVTHPSLPVKTVKELIALARSKPGQLNYASTGTGTAGHLAGELFKGLAKVEYQHIPYKGGGPAVVDLVAGQVHFMFATAASVLGHTRSGRLRALAVTSAQRSSAAPELPTVSEAAIAGFEALTWHGIVVPAATPAPIVGKINSELNAALATNELKERLAAQGVEARGGKPEEFAAFLRSEIPKWSKVVRDSSAKVE
ncbi:MAG: tripartite tricarboxylate transporter substrate binding protein [Betaproteobacteria bacterium]|nr:tripartite tricarboxylate transporter substrate binding protein [Betaproteobacteria bacterium]